MEACSDLLHAQLFQIIKLLFNNLDNLFFGEKFICYSEVPHDRFELILLYKSCNFL